MITAQQKKALQRLFATQPIRTAYLFGSLARGKGVVKDDADIAVSVASELSRERRFALRLLLMERISRILQRDVDVVILNDVRSPFFQYVIVSEGQLLYQRSELHRIEEESAIYSTYFDLQPFLTLYNRHYVTHRHQ